MHEVWCRVECGSHLEELVLSSPRAFVSSGSVGANVVML
jgi:hypothetical protein